MRRSLNKANGVGRTRVKVPEGQRKKHARAKRRGVVGVAELKDVEEGKGAKAIRGENIDHVVGGRANISAGAFPRGESKASEEEARDGQAILKGERTKSLNRDDFLHQVSVQEDPSRGCKIVGSWVLEDSNFRTAVGVNFPRKKVGILEGFVFQRAPEAGAEGQAEVGQGSLSMFLAGKKKVESRVGNNDVFVGGVSFRVARDGQAGGGLREEREKGKLVVKSDSAEGKLSHARVFIQNDLVPNEDTGADPT
jgi:hypothetical protein